MKGLSAPSLETAVDVQSYLRSLIEENQARQPKFSIRWFCQRLKWPPSYINDVLAGRRPLSLNRALELAKFLKLDASESEHLVMLVLAGSGEPAVAAHFARERGMRFGLRRESLTDSLGTFDHLEHILIFTLLASAGARLSTAIIKSRLYTLSDRSDDEIDQIVDGFFQAGLCEETPDGKLRLWQRSIDYNVDGATPERRAAYFVEHVRSALRYLESPRRASPGAFHSRIMALTPERAAEFRARLDQLQTWFAAATAEPPPAEGEGPREVFQFIGALFPLSRSDCL